MFWMFKKNKAKICVPILGYHEVSEYIERNEKIRSMHPSYCLSTGQFESQVEYLYNGKFKSLSLAELLKRNTFDLQNRDKRVVITFDDGHVGNFIYAFPILKKFNFVATFFVTVNWIGNSKMLNWEQLVEMSKSGMSIQSHGMIHTPLASLSKGEIKYELLKSKEIIEDKIGKEVKFLSVPHGSIDSRCKEIAKEIGYQGICTSKVGYFTYCDYFEIERVLIAQRYGIEKFRRIMELNHLTITELKINKQFRNSLKRIIGIDAYRKIYRRLFNIK